MSNKVHNGCCRIQGDIQYCAMDHTYVHLPTKKKLASVTKVIHCVYSTKSWDGVDEKIIENARVRGELVDKYMAAYVRDKTLTIQGEREDVVESVVIAHRIWEAQFGGARAEAQKIVYDLNDGIAGTIDFDIDELETVADLKRTYSREASWVLQLGAYAKYRKAQRGGIIHVSPRVYPEGGRWLEYDIPECVSFWNKALDWWRETKLMEKFAR